MQILGQLLYFVNGRERRMARPKEYKKYRSTIQEQVYNSNNYLLKSL